ncbi:MAG: ion transporter [Methanotrichaceae archaeon]|nr:ion transporter [Methanotrichaceae archaeon]
MKSKEEIYGILEPGGDDSKYFDPFIISLILLNVAAIILGSIEVIRLQFWRYLFYFEVFSVAVFSIEYVFRLWSCDVQPQYRGLKGHIKYMVTPFAIIDLLAVLPFYFGILLDLRFLRIFRVFRIFRVMKLGRYNEKIMLFEKVFYNKKEELLLSIFILLIVMTVSSIMVYEVEHEAQPESFGSIPQAMWWGIVTLATVGYGDVYPVTAAGKVIAGIVILLGIALFALPAGILASGFSEAHREEKNNRPKCPKCGR